ncbi:glycosyl transferases group 1 family protein [Escherichia coli 95.0083]|nr:glycosyl transferases group 1 family protein [Escherichia coli 95.0083]
MLPLPPEYQQLFRRGDLMLPISDLWAGRLQKMGCPREKIAVSRMGVDMTRFSPRPVKAPATPLEIISVARLTEKKGLHVAIEACRQLKEQGVAFRYRILGIGPWERRLRTLIEQYQLEDVVEMPGFKPSHEVKAMLDDADVFLLPSVTGADGDMEGIPVALMEAMAGWFLLCIAEYRNWWRLTNPAGWCLRTMLAHWRNDWRRLANWTPTNWLRSSNARAKKLNTILTSR